MCTIRYAASLVAISNALLLAACGGDGGVASIPVAPTAVATPAPPPPPPPPPAPPADFRIGLASDKPFAVAAIAFTPVGLSAPAEVRFEYLPEQDRYRIDLPQYEAGLLRTIGLNGSYDASGWKSISGSYNAVTSASSDADLPVKVSLAALAGPYNTVENTQYTSWGGWHDEDQNRGIFVYGIPTATGDIPVSGSASYQANVIGEASDQAYIQGRADLRFDFGAGQLSGSMQTEYCPWDCTALPRYEFASTVYATGSREFSGRFQVPDTTLPSAFQGSFNGPAAAELMATWNAPFFNPDTKTWDQMAGIWLGRKGS